MSVFALSRRSNNYQLQGTAARTRKYSGRDFEVEGDSTGEVIIP